MMSLTGYSVTKKPHKKKKKKCKKYNKKKRANKLKDTIVIKATDTVCDIAKMYAYNKIYKSACNTDIHGEKQYTNIGSTPQISDKALMMK
jgi:hypothetical protein